MSVSPASGNSAKAASAPKTVEPPEYVSENPEDDWQRFQDGLRQIASVPKKTVDQGIAEEKSPTEKRKAK